MIFRLLKEDDIELIAQKYMDYYNTHEEGCWTIEKAKKRVRQMIRIDDSMCFALFEQGEIIGFILGFYREFDDLVGYVLDEIIVLKEYQNKGYGAMLISELEKRMREHGAQIIELSSVNDEHHMHFYQKVGFYLSDNFAQMSKFI